MTLGNLINQRFPKKIIMTLLRDKPIIDYERHSELLAKLVTQVCDHYSETYGYNGLQNIVMMYKIDITDKMYTQICRYVCSENRLIHVEIVSAREYNIVPNYSYKREADMSENYEGDIRSILFHGFKKGVYEYAKFDSNPELMFARVLEGDGDVMKWLRPAPKEFNITYNGNRIYEPDFVVETEHVIYLAEVKAEKDLNDRDVLAKKDCAVKYCKIATEWDKRNDFKEWRHQFIPSQQVQYSSTFAYLTEAFWVK